MCHSQAFIMIYIGEIRKREFRALRSATRGSGSRLPVRSALLPSAEVSAGHPRPLDSAAFVKAGETFVFSPVDATYENGTKKRDSIESA